MSIRLLHGDCREVLKTLPDASVQCCITSPPYWGLRSYLPVDHHNKHLEIGSEPTLQAWVTTMVEVFREVRRVLRDDGTLWLNLGDAYANDGKWGGKTGGKQAYLDDESRERAGRQKLHTGLKPKDLMGQPWRVAFALQDDGWWLRQELIWAKKNPMPESIRDRFTKGHEHVFLLSKSERYYFDLEAVKEPASDATHARYAMNGGKAPAGSAWGHGDLPRDAAGLSAWKQSSDYEKGAAVGRRQGPPGNPAERSVGVGHNARPRKAVPNRDGTKNNASFDESMADMPATRNPRSVRWLASEAFKGAHFATYPPALIEPFVLAGCPEGGTVLDPFGGSGTTGLVCDRHHRHAVLIDIDERNLPMARDRIAGDAPLFAEVVTS